MMYRNIRIWGWLILLLGGLLTGGGTSVLHAAEGKPVVAISVGGYDAIWKAVDSIADRMGYKQNVVGFRAVIADVQGLDKTQPGGIVVLTNGKEFFPFGFLPVKKIDDLMFMGVESIKDSIEEINGVKIYHAQTAKGRVSIELLERDGWLFIFEEGKKKSLPSGDPSRFLDGLEQKYFLGLKLWLENISPDLLDSLFSLARQRLAVPQAQTAAQWEVLKKVGDTFIASALRASSGVTTDATGTLKAESNTQLKAGSELASIYCNGSQEESQWTHIFQPTGAVCSALVCARQPKNNQEFQQDNVRNTFNNMLMSMETTLDDKDLTKVKKIVAPLQELVSAIVSQEKLDGAITLTTDPLLVFGQSVVNGEKLTEFLKQLDKEALADEPVKGRLKIASEKVGTYAISSFILPLADLQAYAQKASKAVEVPPILADRTVAFYAAIRSDAIICVLGLDQKAAYEKIKSLAAQKLTGKKVLHQEYYLSCKETGTLLKNLKLTELPQVKDYAFIFDLLAKADSKATLSSRIKPVNKLSITEEFCIDGGVFAVMGDVVRSLTNQLNKGPNDGKKKNDLQDSDSLFDN